MLSEYSVFKEEWAVIWSIVHFGPGVSIWVDDRYKNNNLQKPIIIWIMLSYFNVSETSLHPKFLHHADWPDHGSVTKQAYFLKIKKARARWAKAFVLVAPSDIEGFRKEDVKDGFWIFESYKTKKVMKIPFKGFVAPALDILKKYDYELPSISAQKFNDYIKEVGELAGIDDPVTIKR